MDQQETQWLLRALRKIAFFSGFSLECVEKIMAWFRKKSYRSGSTIIKEGTPGKALYIIQSGRVRVTRRTSWFSSITLAELGEGDFFGEMALVSDQPTSATVKALEPTTVYILNRHDFSLIIQDNPDLGCELNRVIEQRQCAKNHSQE